MAASTTWTQPSLCNTWVKGVRCSGFAKVNGKNDYAFIIETEWSDEREFFVKRTFGEFQVFHASLLRKHPELKKLEKDKLTLRSGIKDLFVKDKKQLAESREALINTYLRNLIGLPEHIAQSGVVLSFFESRLSDPKPCKSCSPTSEVKGILASAPNTQCDNGLDNGDSDAAQYGSDSSAPFLGEINDTELSSNEDDDYFLDIGPHELMLTNVQQSTDPSTMCPESMWCSNGDRFSTLLKTSMTTMPSVTLTTKHAVKMATFSNPSECSVIAHSDEECNGEMAENSDTESQLTEQITEEPDDKIVFGDELYSKAVAAAMEQDSTQLYYLFTGEST